MRNTVTINESVCNEICMETVVNVQVRKENSGVSNAIFMDMVRMEKHCNNCLDRRTDRNDSPCRGCTRNPENKEFQDKWRNIALLYL